MNKHAYLVMAHHQFPLLQTTLRLLDDPRNDFFIHMDKKAGAIDFEEIRRAAFPGHFYRSPLCALGRAQPDPL